MQSHLTQRHYHALPTIFSRSQRLFCACKANRNMSLNLESKDGKESANNSAKKRRKTVKMNTFCIKKTKKNGSKFEDLQILRSLDPKARAMVEAHELSKKAQEFTEERRGRFGAFRRVSCGSRGYGSQRKIPRNRRFWCIFPFSNRFFGVPIAIWRLSPKADAMAVRVGLVLV